MRKKPSLAEFIDGKLDTFGAYGYTWQQVALDNNVLLFQTDGNNRIACFERLDLKEAMEKANSFISCIIEENLPLNNNLNQLQREINSLLLQ